MISDSNYIPALEKRVQYNASYLKYLLQDVTFVSYLNVFLNLPIFPRRISYIPSKKSFSIEPALMRKYLHVHHSKLCCWLAEKRLPMFIKSHLYFHYLLCKTLCKDNDILKSFLSLEAQCAHLSPIKDISGFYNFHHFMLSSGQGHEIVTCWLDIEKIHSVNGEEKAVLIENFFDTYLFLDSPRMIQQQYRELAFEQISASCCGLRFVRGSLKEDGHFLQQFKDKLLREKKLFRHLQEKLSNDMRSYWLPRYYAHLSRREAPNDGWTPSILGEVPKDVLTPSKSGSSLHSLIKSISPSGFETEPLTEAECLPRQMKANLCSSDGLRRTSRVIYSHGMGMDIATEDSDTAENTESLTERNLKNFVGRIESERLECRKRAASMVAPVSATLTVNANCAVEEENDRRSSFLKSSKIAPSALHNLSVNAQVVRRFSSISHVRRGSNTSQSDPGVNLFDSSKSRLVERLQRARKPSGLVKQPPSKSVNWSRHKTSRPKGTTFETCLEKELDLYRCCPCTLRDEIYKENYCDALKEVFNETSLKEVDINNLLEACIASDATGGEDFKEFLSQKKEKKALHSYEFWVAVENFSNKYGSDQCSTFCARGYAMDVVGFFSEKDKVSFDWSFEKNQMVHEHSNPENLEKDLHSLLYSFTHPDGHKFVDWDDPFTDSLWFAIVNNHSILEWLLLAQKFATRKLTSEWLEYIQNRENEFLQNCTVFKEGGVPPPFLQHTSEDLLFETISSPNSHIMWGAMQLAEAIKYPGQNKPVLVEVEDYRSPDSRCRSGASTQSSTHTSPSRLFGDSKPPNRRMLAGVTTPEEVPLVTVNEGVIEEVTQTPSSASGRRGDALSSMSMTDPTLAQLEYNLYNVSGLDLSTDRLNTVPKNFMDVVRTRELLAKFRQFLLYNDDNQDTSILFFQIVESLKSCRNPKQKQERMQFIQQKFFGPVSSLKTKLMIDKNCSVYKELCSSKKTTNTILISAQTLVTKEMESVYWLQFIEAFPSHIREKIISMTTRGTLERKEFGKEKNRRLWSNFTINVINFKNGIMDPKICKHFREFLAGYVREITDKCTKNTQKRQVVNNKLIDIEKIHADLNFFIEVEKYKEICESVQASARIGNYSPVEEEMLIKKGRVLYQCYIDSVIPPKVQINITHDKVTEIRKLHDACLFERGMFHDAALGLFPSLTYFWKKFCLQRHSPADMPIVESDKLILKERIVKGEMFKNKGHKTTTPKLHNLTVIHVGHVAQGVVHLLNRYTESTGLLQQLAQNHPSGPNDRMSRMTRITSVASTTKNDGDRTTGSSLGVKPVDRRLSVLNNYGDRRSSVMTTGRLQTMRES